MLKENPPKPCPTLDFRKKIEGFLFDPIPFGKHEDYYNVFVLQWFVLHCICSTMIITYLEMIKLQKTNFKSMQRHQVRREICLNWWFSSPTEIKHHVCLLHPNTSVTNMVENMEEQPIDESKKLQHCWFKANGKVCNVSFPTYHQFLTHTNKSGHKISRKRRVKEINSAESIAE